MATAPYIDGDWVYTVTVRSLTTEETAEQVAEATARKEKSVRDRRDKLLAETDYLALSDNTLSTEMATYRQALRDITDHANFPDLVEASLDGTEAGDWPVKP